MDADVPHYPTDPSVTESSINGTLSDAPYGGGTTIWVSVVVVIIACFIILVCIVIARNIFCVKKKTDQEPAPGEYFHKEPL